MDLIYNNKEKFRTKKIGVTYGDLNSIGFEVMVKALNELKISTENVIIIGNEKAFELWASSLTEELNSEYPISKVELDTKAFEIGKENRLSGEHTFLCLKRACELAKAGKIDAIVTAPVSKNVLNLAGHDFRGQTEVLEKFLGKSNEATDKSKKAEMLFVANNFRMLLLTRHIALNEVAKSITKNKFKETAERLVKSLQEDFGIKAPQIGILALNPHAGENGILGREEKEILIPTIEELNRVGYNFSMPLVADAECSKLAKSVLNGEKPNYDCYISMYHDQGLIPIKMLYPETAVNTTIGLDVIRTSPSHGTAYDIAGKGIAKHKSMSEAIKLAFKLSK